MIDLLHILTILLLATPLGVFGLYGIVLLSYYKGNNPVGENRDENGGQGFQPKVSVLVPTHNEKSIISKKIDNLLNTSYPKNRIEFIFIDDSNDSTPSIIQEYTNRFLNIRLFHYDTRIGYSASMIAGCKAANGEILVFNDAGSFLEKSTIGNLVRHFRNPKVGGVTGRGTLVNKDESVGGSEESYLRLSDFMRIGETRMDSTFHFSGESCAVRKELVTDIDSCPATFDTAVALHIRQKGYKTMYDPEARFYEYAPLTHSDRIKQKTIRATNLIKIVLMFKGMIFKRKYGAFGCFILPMNLAMLVIVPLVIPVALISLAVLTFFDPFFGFAIWGLLGLVVLLSLIIGRRVLFNFLEFEYSLLEAFRRVFFTKKSYDKIETIASTRR
jgi:biofilm PGA synthesis N-glycosyltransferase PgaC